jgi:hypothetical protein
MARAVSTGFLVLAIAALSVAAAGGFGLVSLIPTGVVAACCCGTAVGSFIMAALFDALDRIAAGPSPRRPAELRILDERDDLDWTA